MRQLFVLTTNTHTKHKYKSKYKYFNTNNKVKLKYFCNQKSTQIPNGSQLNWQSVTHLFSQFVKSKIIGRIKEHFVAADTLTLKADYRMTHIDTFTLILVHTFNIQKHLYRNVYNNTEKFSHSLILSPVLFLMFTIQTQIQVNECDSVLFFCFFFVLFTCMY